MDYIALAVGAAAAVGVGIYYLLKQHDEQQVHVAAFPVHRPQFPRQPQAGFQRGAARAESEEVLVPGKYRVSQSVY